MLGGCLLLIAVFGAALMLELQAVQALGLEHPWIVATVLALFATLAVGCVHGIVAALRRRASPQTDPSRWQDGEPVRLGGTIRPVDGALRTPFGGQEAVAVQYRARASEHGADTRQGSPGWRGMAMARCALDTGGLSIPLSGMPTLRHFPEAQFSGDNVLRRAACHLADTRWQIAPDLLTVDPGVAADMLAHGADAQPAHLIDRSAANLLQMEPGVSTPEHYLGRLAERAWLFAERAIPPGCEVTVTGTWRALPPRIEIGYGARTAEHAIRPGGAAKIASSELMQTLAASAVITALAAGAHYIVHADGGTLYRTLLAAIGLPQ